jgi:type IV secretory pathway VirB6-like protein
MKMRYLNIVMVLVFSLFLSSCVVSFGDDTVQEGCETFDQIFHHSKISDVTVGNVTTKGKRIQICDVSGNTIDASCKGISSWVYAKVKIVLEGSIEKLWKAISDDTDYRSFISGCIVLVIMFYGLMVMFGMVQVSGYSALMVFLRISFVWLFATNYDIFHKYVINTFEAIVQDTTKAASNIFINYSTTSNESAPEYGVLQQIDLMISYIWDPKVMKLVMALFTAGSTGFFWALTLFGLTIMYLMGVLNAIKIFIIALIGRYVLYALGPIFLTFALFTQTRSLFESWVEQLTSFTLQPVFLFIFLGIFHVLLAGMIINLHTTSVRDDETSIGTIKTITAVCWMDKATTGQNSEKMKVLEVGNCKIKNLACNSPAVAGVRIACECDTDASTKQPVAGGWIKVEGLGGKIDLSFVAMLTSIILSYMLMPMANWVVTLAASLSGGMVSAANAVIPGMNRLENQIGKGIDGALNKSLGSGNRSG